MSFVLAISLIIYFIIFYSAATTLYIKLFLVDPNSTLQYPNPHMTLFQWIIVFFYICCVLLFCYIMFLCVAHLVALSISRLIYPLFKNHSFWRFAFSTSLLLGLIAVITAIAIRQMPLMPKMVLILPLIAVSGLFLTKIDLLISNLRTPTDYIYHHLCLCLAISPSIVLFAFLDQRYASPLTKNNFSVFLMLLGGAVILSIFIYRAVLVHLDKIACYHKLRRSVCFGAIFLFLTIILSGTYYFFYENKQVPAPDISQSSNTAHAKKNIPYIFLIVIDTLRSDHLGVYGYQKKTSPYLDQLAKENVFFKNCYVSSSWTKPTIATLFTSLYLSEHHMWSHYSFLEDKVQTLAETLSGSGYNTYGIVANPQIAQKFNYAQGFDLYNDSLVQGKLHHIVTDHMPLPQHFSLVKRFIKNLRILKITGRTVNGAAFRYLNRFVQTPLFFYIHYIDPHEPYRAPQRYVDLMERQHYSTDELKYLSYDAEIRHVDDHVKNLMDFLKTKNIYDESLVIITSDHGEAFEEHAHFSGHGQTVYEEQIKVPLIVKLPRAMHRQAINADLVGIIDIPNTIAALAGITSSPFERGRKLFDHKGHLISQPDSEMHSLLIDHRFNDEFMQKGVITSDGYKYIANYAPYLSKKLNNDEIYNLTRDPGEKNNLAKDIKVLYDRLVKQYEMMSEDINSTKFRAHRVNDSDPEILAHLKSLGYL